MFILAVASSPKDDDEDAFLNLFEEDEDNLIDIPALPSEMGRKASETLPVVEATADSNSEDESASSSSVQL